MKTAILALTLLAALPAIAQTPAPAGTAHPSPYNFGNVSFPRIEADNKVTFQFTAPDAKKVQVAIVNVANDMVKGDDGVWTYTTKEPQAPGFHIYWMVVDGAIVLDPNTETFIGFSHMCNGFEVPATDEAFYQIRDVPHGSVVTKNYFAKASGKWRKVIVYTPPGYESDLTTRYPVLYLQHGGGEDRRVWTELGRTNVILDNLISEKKAKPFLVVMETSVDPGPRAGGPGRAAGAPPAPGAAPAAAAAPAPAAGTTAAAPAPGAPGRGRGPMNFSEFENRLLNEIIPFVDANFRTIPTQPNRAMAGLSMGGMQTRSIAPAHLDVFSHMATFSGGGIQPADVKDLEAFKKSMKVVFFSFGSLEGGAVNAKAAADNLKAAGVNAFYYESPGTAHEFQTWRRSLREFAPLLFQN